LVTDKKAWTEKGFDPQEAEAIVDKYYTPEAFKHIPPNAILVPMPSTSGKNVLPRLFAERIAKDTGAKRFEPRIAESIARKEAKKKTSFWQKLADPVIYKSLEGIDQLKALAAEGRPIYIVEDIHTTGESWLAMRQLLKQEGIELQGVAVLAANELRLASDKDIERIAQKYAYLTGSTLDEARKVIKLFTNGKFRAIAQKLEHSLSRKDARQAAQRLAALAKIHAREGAPQRGNGPEISGKGTQAGPISDLTLEPPPPPSISLTPEQINKQLDSLARVNSGITSLDRLWDDFSGAATHPASFTTESINKALSACNRMRLLGGSLFANLSDIALQHPLQLWLQNGLPHWPPHAQRPCRQTLPPPATSALSSGNIAAILSQLSKD
jgi:orotate phosphoribosyltransferase